MPSFYRNTPFRYWCFSRAESFEMLFMLGPHDGISDQSSVSFYLMAKYTCWLTYCGYGSWLAKVPLSAWWDLVGNKSIAEVQENIRTNGEWSHILSCSLTDQSIDQPSTVFPVPESVPSTWNRWMEEAFQSYLQSNKASIMYISIQTYLKLLSSIRQGTRQGIYYQVLPHQ